MKSRTALWLLACCALVMLGCAKGDTGPTGPQGPAGTANVIYSSWYSPTTWEAQAEFGIAYRTYTMTAPSLTQQIIDNGVVLVYMRFAGVAPEIMQLPVVIAASPALNFQYQAQAGSIRAMYYSPSSPTTTPSVIPSDNQVRYVLIPGGVAASSTWGDGSSMLQGAAALRSMSYADVCRRYGIPE